MDQAGDAVMVTADSVDPRYSDPYIEVNELRQEPVPHRYVHGGFSGTDARFSFYFPLEDQYQGRFFHNSYPLALTSDIAPFPIQFDVAVGNLGFTIDSGAYYVQTNNGGADQMTVGDAEIGAYRVNAAAAKYSRVVAAEIYGEHRPFGYLFGGSGGSYQVMGSAENTRGVWDGFLPYVLGTPYAIPSAFTVRQHTLRILKEGNKFPAVMDAIDPGGSGDPYAELNEEEAAALREATLLGYPLRGWWNHETLTSGYFVFNAPLIQMRDPTYKDDFWSKSGYLGTNPDSSIGNARFQFETSVAAVIDGFPRQIELEDVEDRNVADAQLIVLDGPCAGREVPIASANGKEIGFVMSIDQEVVNSLKPGDRVRIDNSWALAMQTYQRHQVPPTTDLYGWNQYRDAEGKPIYPQRDVLIGPIGATRFTGTLTSGHITGKVLALEVLMDIDALPWQADWYRTKVKDALGERFDDNFALYFIDHAQHDNPLTTAAHAHAVSFAGALQQALRDLSMWAEEGVRPSQTRYEVIDTQVHVPDSAVERGGIQPVVHLQANGGLRTHVAVGQPVVFTATVEVPRGAGTVVAAEWDFEGVGTYPVQADIAAPAHLVTLTASYAFAKPGTYFPVLRAASQREGDVTTPYGRVENIGRARVVAS